MGYEERKEELGLTYGIIDKPNWFSSIFFGCQVRISYYMIHMGNVRSLGGHRERKK